MEGPPEPSLRSSSMQTILSSISDVCCGQGQGEGPWVHTLQACPVTGPSLLLSHLKRAQNRFPRWPCDSLKVTSRGGSPRPPPCFLAGPWSVSFHPAEKSHYFCIISPSLFSGKELIDLNFSRMILSPLGLQFYYHAAFQRQGGGICEDGQSLSRLGC